MTLAYLQGPPSGLGRQFEDIRLLCGFGIAFGHSSLETLLPVSTFCIIRSAARVVQLGSVHRPKFPAQEGLKTLMFESFSEAFCSLTARKLFEEACASQETKASCHSPHQQRAFLMC